MTHKMSGPDRMDPVLPPVDWRLTASLNVRHEFQCIARWDTGKMKTT